MSKTKIFIITCRGREVPTFKCLDKSQEIFVCHPEGLKSPGIPEKNLLPIGSDKSCHHARIQVIEYCRKHGITEHIQLDDDFIAFQVKDDTQPRGLKRLSENVILDNIPWPEQCRLGFLSGAGMQYFAIKQGKEWGHGCAGSAWFLRVPYLDIPECYPIAEDLWYFMEILKLGVEHIYSYNYISYIPIASFGQVNTTASPLEDQMKRAYQSYIKWGDNLGIQYKNKKYDVRPARNRKYNSNVKYSFDISSIENFKKDLDRCRKNIENCIVKYEPINRGLFENLLKEKVK